eukprot:Polyplicarium_translucidae@DN1175_c0_g1_i1.p2
MQVLDEAAGLQVVVEWLSVTRLVDVPPPDPRNATAICAVGVVACGLRSRSPGVEDLAGGICSVMQALLGDEACGALGARLRHALKQVETGTEARDGFALWAWGWVASCWAALNTEEHERLCETHPALGPLLEGLMRNVLMDFMHAVDTADDDGERTAQKSVHASQRGSVVRSVSTDQTEELSAMGQRPSVSDRARPPKNKPSLPVPKRAAHTRAGPPPPPPRLPPRKPGPPSKMRASLQALCKRVSVSGASTPGQQ